MNKYKFSFFLARAIFIPLYIFKSVTLKMVSLRDKRFLSFFYRSKVAIENSLGGVVVTNKLRPYDIRKIERKADSFGISPSEILYVCSVDNREKLQLDKKNCHILEGAWLNPEVDRVIHDDWFFVKKNRQDYFQKVGLEEVMEKIEIFYTSLEISLRRHEWAIDRALETGAKLIILIPNISPTLVRLMMDLRSDRPSESNVPPKNNVYSIIIGKIKISVVLFFALIVKFTISMVSALLLLSIDKKNNAQIIVSDVRPDGSNGKSTLLMVEEGRRRGRSCIVLTTSLEMAHSCLKKNVPAFLLPRLGVPTRGVSELSEKFSRHLKEFAYEVDCPAAVKAAILYLSGSESNDILKDASYLSIVLKKIFDKTETRGLLLQPHWSVFASWVGYEARTNGFTVVSTPTVTVGAFNASVMGWEDVDIIPVYGDQGQDAFHALGYEIGRLPIIGNIFFDSLMDGDRSEALQQVEAQLRRSLPKGKRVILVGASGINRDELDWVRSLGRSCRRLGDVVVIYKPHPALAKGIPDLEEDEIFLLRSGSVVDAIRISNLVITDYSTVGAQAILMDKPLMVVNTTGKAFPANDYVAMGVAPLAKTADEVPEVATRILNSMEIVDQKALELFIRAYNGPNDGKACQRLWDILDHTGFPK